MEIQLKTALENAFPELDKSVSDTCLIPLYIEFITGTLLRTYSYTDINFFPKKLLAITPVRKTITRVTITPYPGIAPPNRMSGLNSLGMNTNI